jgi:hypothetical protein
MASGSVAVSIVVSVLVEAEHLADRAGDSIEGTVADALSAEPVILNESHDRGLVGDGVIDEIPFRPG